MDDGYDPDSIVVAQREADNIFQEVDFGAPQIDRAIERMGDQERFTAVQNLTAWGKTASRTWKAGTRVAFLSNLESLLTYTDCPDPGTNGTVVTVRTGSGDTTTQDDHVFVLWDDGKFRPMVAKHIEPVASSRTANAVRMVVGNLGDISSFFTPRAGSGEDLVHKATKDLWSLKKDGEQYVIERLFNEDGNPLKV